MCDKGYAWNPSDCEFQCDNSCDIGEYLDYESCKCKKGWQINQLMNVMKILKKQVQLKLI